MGVCVCVFQVGPKPVCILSLRKRGLALYLVYLPLPLETCLGAQLPPAGPFWLLVAEIQPLYTSARLNLRDRVLGELERNSFIALPGKGGHSGLMPSELCVPP